MVYWHRGRILERLAKHGRPTPYRLAQVAHISEPAAGAVLRDPPVALKRLDMVTAERVALALGFATPFAVLRYEPDSARKAPPPRPPGKPALRNRP